MTEAQPLPPDRRGASVCIPAYAKLNLALAVGAAEPPRNFHPICSWFVPISLCDDLTLTTLPTGTESVYKVEWAEDAPKRTEIDWDSRHDLAGRAHRLMEERVGRSLPVRIHIRKRTPVGGGLGGGSSDAAAALRGLNLLFELGLGRGELVAMGERLGSDVAFFIDDVNVGDVAAAMVPPRAAIVSGYGERVERVEGVRARAVLIIPPFGCPTADVYRAFDGGAKLAMEGGGDGGLRSDDVRRAHALSVERREIDCGVLFNDLMPAAAAGQPLMVAFVGRVLEKSGLARSKLHMSGSGSTLFVVGNDADADAMGRLMLDANGMTMLSVEVV